MSDKLNGINDIIIRLVLIRLFEILLYIFKICCNCKCCNGMVEKYYWLEFCIVNMIYVI